MNLNDLKKQRNDLLAKGSTIAKVATDEHRDLNDAETAELRSLKENISEINEKIAKEIEFRDANGKINSNNEKEDIKMEKELNLEKRSIEMVDLFLRGRENTEEYRSLSMTVGNAVEGTAGNGGISVPQNVADSIIAKLAEQSGVFNLVEKIPSVTGTLKVVRESATPDDTVIVGEGVAAPTTSTTWQSVPLDQKRLAASFQLTNELINDSAVNVVDYAVGHLTRSVARALERQVLIGKDVAGNAGFRGIVGDTGIEKKHAIDLAALTPSDLINMYTDLNQAYQSGATWVVSKKAFQALADLKDGNGQYLIFQHIVSGNAEYSLFGSKVLISDILDGSGTEIILGNFPLGYDVMIKKAMNLVHVSQDTQQALMGGHLVVLDAYMDGVVVNPDAFVLGTYTAATGKE